MASSWHTQYLSISSLINHSTSIFFLLSTVFSYSAFISNRLKWIKTHFDLLFGHITSTTKQTEVRGNKKNFSCTNKLPFRCSIVRGNHSRWTRTRNIYLQVAPNKKTSSQERRERNVLKKYYNELVFFFCFFFLLLHSLKLNWWISDSINFVFVLTSTRHSFTLFIYSLPKPGVLSLATLKFKARATALETDRFFDCSDHRESLADRVFS